MWQHAGVKSKGAAPSFFSLSFSFFFLFFFVQPLSLFLLKNFLTFQRGVGVTTALFVDFLAINCGAVLVTLVTKKMRGKLPLVLCACPELHDMLEETVTKTEKTICESRLLRCLMLRVSCALHPVCYKLVVSCVVNPLLR